MAKNMYMIGVKIIGEAYIKAEDADEAMRIVASMYRAQVAVSRLSGLGSVEIAPAEADVDILPEFSLSAAMTLAGHDPDLELLHEGV